MFDIGFWELLVIAVVTLLIVGPDELPTVVRTVSRWITDIRQYVSSVKADFDREMRKAEELKELMAKESEVSEMHKVIDEAKGTIPVDYRRMTTNDDANAQSDAKDRGDSAGEERQPRESSPRQ